ncbi:kinase-like domain-containing protein, partial [Mycena crocata]
MHTNAIDTTLHRLIVKLSFACSKLPSSLSIEGIEQICPQPVASGGFGDIYKAVYRSKDVALKQIRFYQNQSDEARQKVRAKLCQEALLWKNLDHEFIMPFIGLYPNDIESPTISMVCPFMNNGTIVDYLKKLKAARVDVFLLQIAQGLEYLHSQSVVHGDLRGTNILIDDAGNARLADFGLASYADATLKSSARAGSTRWMAPELLSPEELHFPEFRRTLSTDVYAFACVCYELYSGAHPFSEMGEALVIISVIAEKRPKRLASIPQQMWQVIQACWCQTPGERLTATTII